MSNAKHHIPATICPVITFMVQFLPSSFAPFRLLSQNRPIRRRRWTVDRFSRFILAGYHGGSVSSYDEAEALIVQHDFMHLSLTI